jgi:hypothetical protein
MSEQKREARRDLRVLADHLFDTLEGLKSGTMKPEQAKAVQGVAQTIINIATVSVKAMNARGGVDDGLGFFPPEEQVKALPPARREITLTPDPKDPLQSRRLRTEPPGR